MFLHNFKYILKILIKNKSLLFWTLLFPLILGTLFHFAFMDLEKNDTFKPFNIAIVSDNNSNHTYLKKMFQLLSTNQENKLFNIKYTNLENAEMLLKDEEIVGYIQIFEDVKLVINQNGINETILKNITLKGLEDEKTIETLINKELNNNSSLEIEQLYQDIVNKLNQDDLNISHIKTNNLSYTMIEFYTLIAMTCLYGGLLGIFILNKLMPNNSSTGKRITISKFLKDKLIISSFLAIYLIQIISLIIIFLYIIFVLKIDYGNYLFLTILISLIGSLFSLALGMFIGSLKLTENLKTGILISFTMLGCFLSGMMGITMKYLLDKNMPIINKINPVNLITDSFYTLYYYGITKRYFLNLISLLLFSIILIILSIKKIRRNTYDSI